MCVINRNWIRLAEFESYLELIKYKHNLTLWGGVRVAGGYDQTIYLEIQVWRNKSYLNVSHCMSD